MVLGIHTNRWNQYLRDMFRVTRGGGWCQMVEIYYNAQSDNGSLTEGWQDLPKHIGAGLTVFLGHALQQWSSRYFESVCDLTAIHSLLSKVNLEASAVGRLERSSSASPPPEHDEKCRICRRGAQNNPVADLCLAKR